MMYNNRSMPRRTSIRLKQTYVGERIEEKVNRIVNNKEPITDGAPLVYTERKDGVLASTDIRTDRFEIAIEAMDKVAQQKLADRTARFKKKLDEANKGGEVGGVKTGETSNKGEQNTPGTGETGKPSQ